ncbi:MAG: primosomal protein N', partial [Clostridia bacterium]
MVVQVLLNKTVKSINKVYDYLVPDELIPNIQIGKRVKVSFGNSKKFDEGVIVKILDTSGYNKKLKYICEILDDVSFIDMSKLKLAKWMSYMYFCNVYDALKLFFMPGTNNINNSKSVSIDYETHLKLIKYDTVKKIKHQQILDYLKGIDSINIKDVMSYFNVSLSVINTLVKNKYIEKIKVLEDKVTNCNLTKSFDLKLNLEQDNALKNINNLNNKYNVTLLHGVTGSGKTEVYLQAIKKVIDDNKNVIVLVPEISLTHQTEERFISRFGNIVSMIHSKINMKKRKQVYLDILNNKTRIVIGARSAIFAPLKNIGLIIIDEEHDSSYESFTTPKYSTFEVADYLARENNCMLLLGSATPNVNTYYNAINGKYNLIKINNRVNNKLPVIEIVDKKQDSLSNTGNISNRLINEIKVNILNNEQTIIFLNKRGYSSYLTCIDCKSVYKCKKCDVAMTLHKSSNLLICHYCGNVEKNINKC